MCSCLGGWECSALVDLLIFSIWVLASYRLTVRTLDFHSNNVGSIPASLNMVSTLRRKFVNRISPSQLVKFTHIHRKGKSPRRRLCIKYTLSFKSLLPFNLPSNLLGFDFIANPLTQTRKSGFTRLVIKNSYILFTWFYYINSLLTQVKLPKNDVVWVPSFFTKPKKRSRFTITKAPMAHKTFSQEQYKIVFYGFLFAFRLPNVDQLSSVNQSVLLVSNMRNSFFFFETNLFFLNRLTLRSSSSDSNFFSLF